PLLESAVRRQMAEAAARLCADQSYGGAGTVEFVLDADTQEYFFLEMNTRIQVEHPVTEMNTGCDLVAMQIEHALGRLPAMTQSDVRAQGHAVECRIYAENPAKNFLPSPGRLLKFKLPPPTHSVRIDSGFRDGDEVSHFYDPMIAKVICHVATRDEAIDPDIEVLGSIEVEGPGT
ncbi:MAG: acetyl-CoA carboxylase biotin carboxylase subunit, partial [Gemmatimonadetes bacterium]|nr:acetyl-CoA carboxylase biotin carboxylase subunit [Gemmatimonadota bacterium]